jgi:hypothetical protein
MEMPSYTVLSLRQYKTLLKVKSRKAIHGRMAKPTYTMIAKKWRVPLSVVLSAASRGIKRHDRYIRIEKDFTNSRMRK